VLANPIMFALTNRPKRSRRDRGSAAVEFAITAPVLIILVLGVADYGVLTYQASALAGATRAGAEVAAADPTTTAASLTALGLFPSGATPTVSGLVCRCIDNTVVSCPTAGSGVVPCASANGSSGTTNPFTAASDDRVLQYISVSATQSVSPVLAWANFGFPPSLSATTTLRVQ
jgi:Flp pilus assembly protein TadG